MAIYELTEKRKHKKFQIYKKLVENNLLDSITDKDFKKHGDGMTRSWVIQDAEKSFPGLFEDITDKHENEGTIVVSNKAPTNFSWNVKNIPVIEPEFYVYNNTSDTTAVFEELRKINAYPKAKNNISSTCKAANDDFTTHNNTQFAGIFEHIQGTIRPLTDRTLDAWYDVGVNVTMYQSGIPFNAPNFQKTYYVWYIKGEGLDYPSLGQVGYVYPGQEYNFPYRYRSASNSKVTMFTTYNPELNLPSGTIETPIARAGVGSEGFYAKLQNPNKIAHAIAKVNFNKISTLGQQWHYQGFTLKSFPIFDVRPGDLKHELRGEEVTLDITDKIETSLTWDFKEFTITSDRPDICYAEHDWVNDPTLPKYYIGPSYIRLIGNKDITKVEEVNFTVKATLNDSTYSEEFTFKVTVEQLYSGQTTLVVTPNPMTVKVGETLEYEVDKGAAVTYDVASNVAGLLRVYKGKITGVKAGKGILTFKAQESNKMPTTLNVAFRVDEYTPNPKITPKTVNLNVELGKKATFTFETNCPRANVSTDADNINMIEISSITWAKETTQDTDTLNKNYPISTGSIEVFGKKLGNTKLYLTGYVVQGTEAIEVSINVKVNEPTIDEEVEEVTGDKLATINETDVYWGFHDQAQGQFTYLRSKARPEGNYKNKIFVIPKPTQELLDANPDKEFTLALVEDLNKSASEDDTVEVTDENPNYMDWKEKEIPNVTFTGQLGTVENETYMATETLELFRSQNANVDHKHWISGNGVMVGDVWYKHPGEKGFGVGPAPLEISTYYGLNPMEGCWDPTSVNYGNYQDSNGNVLVYIPRHYVTEEYDDTGKMLSVQVYYPVTMNYSNHANEEFKLTTNGTIKDNIIRDRFNSDTKIVKGNQEYEALKNKLILPRCFVNADMILPGIFVDKYPNGGFTQELESQVFSKKDSVYFGPKLSINKLTGTNINNGNIQPKGNDLGIMSLFASVNRNDVGDFDSATDLKYYNRRTSSMSFITPYVMNMLNRLAMAHAYGCNTITTPNNCAWLGSSTGYINNVTSGRNTSLCNVSNEELALGSHNGQACGVFGLNSNVLEACIGTYQTITAQVAGSNISFSNTITNYTRTADITKISQNFATTYSNAVDNDEVAIPSHISGRQPDTGNGYGLSTYAANGFKATCLINNLIPTGDMLNIRDNVPSSSVWNYYNSNSFKYNLGYTGSFMEVSETATVLGNNINRYDYNSSNVSLDATMNNINLGDHKIKFYTGCESKYETTDVSNGSIINFIPLYGGVLKDKLSYICVPGTPALPTTATEMKYTLASTHAMSCTWYRLGYDPNNNKNNVETTPGVTSNVSDEHFYYLPVTTRRMILPNMDEIANYVNDGTYEKELTTMHTKSYNTFGSKLLTKETNDPWSE